MIPHVPSSPSGPSNEINLFIKYTFELYIAYILIGFHARRLAEGYVDLVLYLHTLRLHLKVSDDSILRIIASIYLVKC